MSEKVPKPVENPNAQERERPVLPENLAPEIEDEDDFLEEDNLLEEEFDENDPNVIWEEEYDYETGETNYYPRKLNPAEIDERKKFNERYEELERNKAEVMSELGQLMGNSNWANFSPLEKAVKILDFVSVHNLPQFDEGRSKSEVIDTFLSETEGELLPEKVFKDMINGAEFWQRVLVYHPEIFSVYNQNEVLKSAVLGIQTDEYDLLSEFFKIHPEPFDTETVDILISNGMAHQIGYHIDEFPPSLYDKNRILTELSKRGADTLGLSMGHDYSGLTEFVKNYPGSFDDVSLRTLLQNKYLYVIAENFEKFPTLDLKEFAHEFSGLDPHLRKALYSRKELISTEVWDEIGLAMMQKDSVELLNEVNPLSFSPEVRSQLLKSALNSGDVEELQINGQGDLSYIKDLPNFEHDDYANFIKWNLSLGRKSFSSHPGAKHLIDSVEFFPIEYRPQLAIAIVEDSISSGRQGRPYYIQEFWTNFEKFGDIDSNHLLQVMLDGQQFLEIFSHLDKFPGIDLDKTVTSILQADGYFDATMVLRYLKGKENTLSQETRRMLVADLIKRDFNQAIEFNSSYTPPLDSNLSEFVSLVGPFGSRRLYEIYNSAPRGVNNKEKFIEAIDFARSALLENNPEALEKIANRSDSLTGEVAKAFLRFDVSDWGDHNDYSFGETINTYLSNKEGYAPLPEEYERTTVEAYRQRKTKGAEEHLYTPEFMGRWPVLINSLQEAEGAIETPSKLIGLYKNFRRTIEKQRESLIEALERAPHEKARENLQKRITELEGVDVRTDEGMADAFNRLYDRKKSPELAEIFRQFGFYKAFEAIKERGAELPQFRGIPLTDPSAEDISSVIEFVQHIAHQETWEKNEKFATKEVQTGLDSLFHVKALENEVKVLTQGRGKGAPVNIEVIPSRDILTEFSGHIGDACWASQYEMLKDFPNISSLTFMVDGRVAGASLLIDAETDKGEALTIIRGLNPLESVVNKLDIDSFVSGITTYLESVASKRGRKLAIVIDGHAGGSATNRPLLYAYLSGRRGTLKPVQGLKDVDTQFNGYRITQDTYYLNAGETK